MVFASLEFLFCFLPITFILYFSIPEKYLKWRNVVLLLVSLIFYGWGEPVYVFLMVFTIAIDYIAGILLEKAGTAGKRKAVLVITIIVNLGILAFFKYYNFIASNLAHIGLSLPALDVSLPIGISFYTFQALSYVIDVYRKNSSVQKNLVAFSTYVTLFPQLIAGPIVRYHDIENSLLSRSHTVDRFSAGIRRFTVGLCKKVLLANLCGEVLKSFLSVPSGTSGLQSLQTTAGAWMAIIFYTFQIYFDFSGYSDMAIGLGKMFGFEFLENFNYPYIAKSITDFWRRWHMSLSGWFREYVYIPLGGNRKGIKRQILNLLIVWMLTGLWHGASWNFVLWGLFYAVLLIIEKLFLLKFLDKIPSAFSHIYTLFFVVLGWVLFYFENFGEMSRFFLLLFGVGSSGFANTFDLYEFIRLFTFIIILVIACTPYPARIFNKFTERFKAGKVISLVLTASGLVLSTAYLVSSSFNPFLYFKF